MKPHQLSATRRDAIRNAVLAACGVELLRSQESASPQQVPATFSSDLKVVNVYVTVRDKKSHVVTDLNKQDFSLSEEGQAQDVRYFARQSDLPLTLGLVIDTTPSESKMLDVEREASLSFLNQVLRPDKDRAFVIRFGDDVELLQDLTSSRTKLEKALDQLDSRSEPSEKDAEAEHGPGSQHHGGSPDSTVLSDAIYLAANDVLKKQGDRKAIILLGDGDHIGNREQQAIEAAERAETAIYAIRIFDQNFGGAHNKDRLKRALSLPGIPGIGGGGPGGWGGGPGGNNPGGQGPGGGGPPNGGMPPRSNGKKHLQDLALRTGGAYYEISKDQSLSDIYGEIEKTLRNQYSLGYTPSTSAVSGYRHIHVSMKEHGLTVQAREGYYNRSATS